MRAPVVAERWLAYVGGSHLEWRGGIRTLGSFVVERVQQGAILAYAPAIPGSKPAAEWPSRHSCDE